MTTPFHPHPHPHPHVLKPRENVAALAPLAFMAAGLLLGFSLQLCQYLRNRRLKRKELAALPVTTYVAPLTVGSPAADCAVCLTEFANGNLIRALPPCHHQFHVSCIDEWLLVHGSCPICRSLLFSSGGADKVMEVV